MKRRNFVTNNFIPYSFRFEKGAIYPNPCCFKWDYLKNVHTTPGSKFLILIGCHINAMILYIPWHLRGNLVLLWAATVFERMGGVRDEVVGGTSGRNFRFVGFWGVMVFWTASFWLTSKLYIQYKLYVRNFVKNTLFGGGISVWSYRQLWQRCYNRHSFWCHEGFQKSNRKCNDQRICNQMVKNGQIGRNVLRSVWPNEPEVRPEMNRKY